MKRILVYLLLIIPIFARSQGSLEAIQQTMQLFDKGDFLGTIKVAEKALPQVRQEFGENSPFYSGMMLFIGLSHFRLYNYKEAEPWFTRQMEIVKKVKGENSMDFIACLNNMALLYRESGKYADAESMYGRAIIITEKLYGNNDTIYAKSLNNQASLYQLLARYTKAEQLFNQSMKIIVAKTGEHSAMYATALNNLATLYSDMGQPLKAKPLLQKAATIRKAVLGEKDPDYAGSLNNLAYGLSALGEFKEAEKYFLQAKEIYRSSLGELHPDYASSLNNLAELYKATGKFEQAEHLYNESLEIRKRTVGEKHPDYALSLNNLAGLYEMSGQYEKSEKLFLQAAAIISDNVGQQHPYYVTELNNLAAHYDAIGNYAKAEPLYLRSKEIRRTLLGETHPSYAMSLNNLATLYQEIGQFSKAEPLYLQALEIWKNSVGPLHPDPAMCTNNLGALYEAMGQLDKAESLYIQARDADKAIFGTDHNDYAIALNNLAGLYARKGDFKKAEMLLSQAKEIWKKIFGDNSTVYATSVNNLAALYRKGQYNLPQSEQLYLQALAIRKKVLGENHPLTADVENDLALLYMDRAMPDKAAPLFLQSSLIIRQNLVQTFPVLSEKEKSNFINQDQIINECNNSFLYLNPRITPAIINNNVDLQLFFKSLSLADTRSLFNSIRNSRDTAVRRLFLQWQAARSLLAKQKSLPADRRMDNLKQKEEEAEDLEKDLGRRSADFRRQQNSFSISLKEVQANLEDQEAAIEFVSFKLYNRKSTDSVIYAAYIIKKTDSAASFVPLFEERRLQQLLDSAGRTPTGVAKLFYRGGNVTATSSLTFDKQLYQLIWQPLEKKLQGISKISYSPSGKLYGIAFHALRIDSSSLLMDKYRLQQYTSTRDIALRGTEKKQDPGSIVLIGSADFTMDSLALVKKKTPSNDIVVNSIPQRGGGAGTWPDLPGTGEEVKKIGDLFRRRKIECKQYLHAEASEENFKKMGEHAPSIIHIATHGYFLPDRSNQGTGLEKGNPYIFSNDPLLRSGLILSGGNYVWSGRPPIEGVEDGIVTAFEIAQLDLSHTGLVVLSACETALGDIKGTEGVFGLQRAFKMAGVKKMIVSLWQVPDKETAELMTSFYNYWLNGTDLENAFLQAQTDMRKKYSPFYWAAFVMVN